MISFCEEVMLQKEAAERIESKRTSRSRFRSVKGERGREGGLGALVAEVGWQVFQAVYFD